MTVSTQERLVAVETNLKNLDTKVTDSFSELKDSVKEVNYQLRELVPAVVTHEQLNEKLTERDKAITAVRLEVVQAKKRTALQTWLTGTLSAVFGVVMTILVQGYLNR